MSRRTAAVTRALTAGLLAFLLAAGAISDAGTALADSRPADPTAPGDPMTVSTDALPTVQIDGVVWSQAVVGTTVYVGGEFTTARPAGSAPGVNTTPRHNLLAYDIRTGELITSFAPDLNAQVKVVTASPDGSRIYVGGSFTQANGQVRYRIAAYNTATGALDTAFHPGVDQQVKAIAVTNDAVYIGGNFTAVGTQARTRLAAFARSNGALLPWAPAADGTVQTLAISPNRSKVIVGGSFTTLTSAGGADSQVARGLGAVDAVSGAAVPFAAGTVINNTGSSSAVLSLSVDADTVYASGYTFGPGTLEGVVAADPETGDVRWIDDCHGDSYQVWASGSAAYVAGHPHVCSNIGGFPQTSPWTFHFGLAFSKAAMGTVGWETGNFVGQPAPRLLNWFPDFTSGKYTGKDQATWSVSGNSQYVVYGGEFLRVNGVKQQGLVRFATPAIAPNKVGPALNDELTPTVRSVVAGTARVTWRATSDQDNETLTYRVYRDGDLTAPVYEVTQASTFWKRPTLTFSDVGLSGGQHSYVIRVSDPFGNTVTTPSTAVTVATGTPGPLNYPNTVLFDGATDYWRLGETSGTTAFDDAGSLPMSLGGTTITQGRTGAIAGDPDTATEFLGQDGNGDPYGYLSTQTPIPGPNEFTVETWFQTTTHDGGKIVGFGNQASGYSSNYDRHVYMEPDGRIVFGVWVGEARTVASSAPLNDGRWHHVSASLSPAGMAMYVDGQLVDSRTDTTVAQAYDGYWRIGGDSPWSGAAFFAGQVDDVAIYPSALTADQVAAHYQLGATGKGPNSAPTASFTAAANFLDVAVDGSGSTDRDGTVAGYAWDFGDGSTGTGATARHTYAAAGTYTVQLTVTDDSGASAATTRTVTVTAPPPNVPPTASFTATASALEVSVDGSASSDSDGTVAAYAWDFGDGTSGTGVTARHAYASAGTYTVRLTATDDDGATGTASRDVTVVAPPAGPTATAFDGFGRTVTSGLGQADLGGAWTTTGGASASSVSGGVGHLLVAKAGGRTTAFLNSVASNDVAFQTTITLPQAPTGGGVYVSVVGRRVGTTDYRAVAKVSPTGQVNLGLSRTVSGVETKLKTVNVPGLVLAPGGSLVVRLDLAGTGTTVLSTKAWVAGTAEPQGWQVTSTDATPELQRAGAIGIDAYVSGSSTVLPVAIDLDDVWAGAAGTAPAAQAPAPAPAPANVPPTAAFTAAVTDLTVGVDGTGSADSDGQVRSYAWDFGDSTSGVGATAQHTYAAAGTYTVRLTVTDDAGATGTATRTVTVTAPKAPAVQPLAADAFERSVAVGLGSADTGGAWTVSGWMGSASVTGGRGHLQISRAGGRATASLDGVATHDVAVQATVALPQLPTGGGVYVSVLGRKVGTSDYRAVLKVTSAGGVTLGLSRQVSGVETKLRTVTVPGLTYAPGTLLTVRFDVAGSGTTALSAKAWVTGSPEPAAWLVTSTDTAPELQGTGAIGLEAYVSSSATALPVMVDVDDLWAGPAGTKPEEH